MENKEFNVTTRYVVLDPRGEKLYRMFAAGTGLSKEEVMKNLYKRVSTPSFVVTVKSPELIGWAMQELNSMPCHNQIDEFHIASDMEYTIKNSDLLTVCHSQDKVDTIVSLLHAMGNELKK